LLNVVHESRSIAEKAAIGNLRVRTSRRNVRRVETLTRGSDGAVDFSRVVAYASSSAIKGAEKVRARLRQTRARYGYRQKTLADDKLQLLKIVFTVSKAKRQMR
jgi:hypothetical protein